MPTPEPGGTPDDTPGPTGHTSLDVAALDDGPRDHAAFRLVVFGGVLLVTLLAGYGIGRLNESMPPAVTAAGTGTADHGDAAHGKGEHAGGAVDESPPHTHGTTAAADPAIGGLAVTSAGMTMVPDATVVPAGRRHPLRFRITGSGGVPVTTYAVVHDKPLHLVVVRRDLSGYQHVHPTMAPDGTWSVDLTLAAPGSYRAIADFTAVVGGRQVPATVGVDLTVAGAYTPTALPPARPDAAVDGYTVRHAGTLRAGVSGPVPVTVTTPGGEPATLQPYLGAYGHLVVLRSGDVGYVHVHPQPRPVDGTVVFTVTPPGPGTYRMFFDFQVDGRVRTAAWTVTAS